MKYSKWQDCLCSIPTSRFKFTMQYVFYIFRCLMHHACIHPYIHTSIHPSVLPSIHPCKQFLLCMFIMSFIYIIYLYINTDRYNMMYTLLSNNEWKRMTGAISPTRQPSAVECWWLKSYKLRLVVYTSHTVQDFTLEISWDTLSLVTVLLR